MEQLEPAFIIAADERTRGGSLAVSTLNKVAQIMLDGGFAVLPSDTAYSVAAIAVSGHIRADINTLLRRRNSPISLSFPSMRAVRRWIKPNVYAERLIAHYCPGPITVVCKATLDEPSHFISEGVRGPDQTIGVRIPDSVVERDVAAATGYPITTVAIRDLETDQPLTSFAGALAVVEANIGKIGGRPWCAIEGTGFYKANSSVVKVDEDGHLSPIRHGDIPFDDILAASR